MPTRVLVLSDVHADREALALALARGDELGCALALCAGDLVGYGDDADGAVALLLAHGVRAVRGNHDRWALRDRVDLSRRPLAEATLAALAALPPLLRLEVEGVRLVVAHAEPGHDMRGLHAETPDDEVAAVLAAAGADVLVTGHTHAPLERRLPDGRLVVNPGTVLRSSGGSVPATGTCGVLELPARRFSVERIGATC